MKRLILILILAAILRFYYLGSTPPSLDWDEVSLAYNAYSLLTTGHDEYGNAFPVLSIRSFNDYKPPMYVYALMPSLLLFGKTDFAIRFPSALAGTLTVLFTYLLTKELFNKKIALVSALLLAISPWSLQFSRIAFEANLALWFFVTGMFFLIRSFTKPWLLPVSAGTLGLAIFSYHSLRLIIPVLVLIILLPRIRWLQAQFKPTILSLLVTSIFIALLLRVISQGAGQARLKTVSIFTMPAIASIKDSRLRYLAFMRQFLIGYLDHFSLNFWFIDADGNPRHHANGFGLLYLIEAPFLIIGILQLIRHYRPIAAILLAWFLLAPVASSITSGTPSAVRSLFFLPTFQIFTALGIGYFLEIRSIRLIRLIIYMLFVISFITYLDLYYRHTPGETSPGWQYGYKQAVEKVMATKDQYDKIIVTTEYDQPYIYFLWYGNYDPKVWINDGEFAKRFDKFEFRSINWDTDRQLPDTFLIGNPREIPIDKVLWRINFLDDTPAFVAAET
jgi:4-amino-4-deoxy-L-arabinose transferase-like glycosyltransferase